MGDTVRHKIDKKCNRRKNDTQLSIATQFMCAKFRQLGIMPSITWSSWGLLLPVFQSPKNLLISSG